MNNQHISIGKAAEILGISVVTLRRWEKSGKLISAFRTFGNHRRYKIIDVLKISNKNERVNIAYARVSSHDQKKDLETQVEFLDNHLKTNSVKNIKIIKDLGSGLNFKKKGLNQLLNLLIASKVDTLYLTHKDRLLRFGSELIFNIASKFGTKIVIINDKKLTFEEQLAADVLEIITVFSAKLYGSRSHKNKLNKA